MCEAHFFSSEYSVCINGDRWNKRCNFVNKKHQLQIKLDIEGGFHYTELLYDYLYVCKKRKRGM